MNDQDLKKSSEHIKYEYKMVNYAAKRLIKTRRSNSEDYKCFLESFLIHVRNLFDFLTHTNSGYDNALLANYYVPGKEQDLKDKMNYVKDKRDDINRYLAHLTRTRNDPTEWNVKKLLDEINQAMKIFLRSVDPIKFQFNVDEVLGYAIEITSEGTESTSPVYTSDSQ